MLLPLRILATLLCTLALACGLALAAPAVSAHSATQNAGIPDLTPYGGYLGNYLAPDGFRVYCIDSPLPWPSGATSGPSTVDVLATTWGSALSASDLTKLNFVLLAYGQTDDPVQAAAVAAFVNAYTSGWARDLGAGYAAGAWYLNSNAEVTSVYDSIWADAQANAEPTGEATLHLDMTDATTGSLAVTASPASATGTVELTGAVRADTGESNFAVSSDENIPIRGIPLDEAREHAVSASASFSAPAPASPEVVLYFTADQQRTIRGSTPGSIEFEAIAATDALPLDFAPVLTTAVSSASPVIGEALVDRVTVSLAEGSRPWRVRADGTPVVLVADGVLYGPFDKPPVQSEAAPPDAPVAATETLSLDGLGEYSSSGSTTAVGPGYYTWVWSIESTRQDAIGVAALPEGFVYRSPFGLPEETHHVTVTPPRLAATGDASQNAAVIALGLVAVGVVLQVRRRGGAVLASTAGNTR